MNFDTTTAAPVTSADELVASLAGTAPTVLAVWAHPDDESFLAGGLLASVGRSNGRAIVATATLGEHGTDDPDRDPPAQLAQRRFAELTAALAELGAPAPRHIGLADGHCHLVPDELGAHLVGDLIDRIDPDLVIGFGPDGVTGHPDHQAMWRWTRRAVAERGDTIPFLSAASTAAWHEQEIAALHELEAFWPGHPDATVEADVVVHLDERRLDTKLAALACHHSQMPPVAEALGDDGFRRLAATEAYAAGNQAAHHRLAALGAVRAPIAA